MSERSTLAALVLFVLAINLPFVGRAYFVDDFYHVSMARGLLDHPARPYDFRADDELSNVVGWERGRPPRMVNPPLFHYFLATVMVLWGEASWKLRTASLIFPLLSIVMMFLLGKRWSRRPWLAPLLLAVSPAFWLTSYSLLIDGALLAMFLSALYCYYRGQESDSWRWAFFSGVFMGACVLVKYPGILIVPVVATLWWFHRKQFSLAKTVLPIVILATLLAGWGLWTWQVYGAVHMLAASSRVVQGAGWEALKPLLLKTLLVFCFFGGSSLWVAASWDALRKFSRVWTWGIALFGILLAALLSRAGGGFPVIAAGMIGFFCACALAFLTVVVVYLRKEEGENRFLITWFALSMIEIILIMPWVAGRYLLLVLPPACWLLEKVFEENYRKLIYWAVVTAGVSVCLAVGDYAQAETIRHLARDLASKAAVLNEISPRNDHHWLIVGDTFSGYAPYLAPLGWKSTFPSEELREGDLLIRPHYRLSSWWVIPQARLRLVARFEYPSRLPLRTMDIPASAGFYASVWGALPYAITQHPLESFDLYRVQAPELPVK